MDSKSVGGRKAKRGRKVMFEPLSPAAQARFNRRLAVLLVLVPLHQMTQEEAN